MALSTVKISDTAEWAARMSFGRRSAIGNSLEPALSNANIVLQTILGPPFSWWWNNDDLVFTCNPTLATATVTNIAIAANVLTITAANTFSAGQEVLMGTLATATFLNGQILEILTATGSSFTAAFTHANYSAADSGTVTAATTQDYTVAAPNFSHIDWAAVQDPSVTPAQWYQMKVEDVLSLNSKTGRPQSINPQGQDSSGNVTFRVMPSPDKAYPVALNIMKAAPQKTSVEDTWAPLPDFMQYIYNWGFLALTWAFSDDSRVGFANQKFTSGLLSRAEGLDEQSRNIFLSTWNGLTNQQQMVTQQGMQARSV
jgi:hypothetical protein